MTINNSADIQMIWLLTVHLSNGETTEHEYQLPSNKSEALKIIKDMTARITRTFFTHPSFLVLHHPLIAYNSSHVAYIESHFTGSNELKEAIAKSFKEPIGFKPNMPNKL